MNINKIINYSGIPHYIRNLRLLILLVFVVLKERKLTRRKIINFLKAKCIYVFRLSVEPPFPSTIMVEVSSLCNLSCPRCRNSEGQLSNRVDLFNKHGHVNEENKFKALTLGSLKFDIFKKVVDELSDRLLFLLLYSSGEPFMNKYLPDMVAYATKNRIATIISTNGHFFTMENCKKILQGKPDLIIISVSGFHQETYIKYHRGGSIEKVKEGISNLCKTKREMNVSTIIAIRYLIFSYNEHLFNEDKKQFLSLGVNLVIPRPGQFFDVEQVKEFAPKSILPYRSSLDNYAATETTNKPCPFLWNSAVIHWDGRVLPCCELSYNPEIIELGNIEEDSFAQIWGGKHYTVFRKSHFEGKRSQIKACKGCHVVSTFFQA